MSIESYKLKLEKRLIFDQNSRVLLLQGPIGNFFNEFAKYINQKGGIVHKIHFTYAEKLFYRQTNTFLYKQTLREWPHFFIRFVRKYKINKVYLMNDSRPYHRSIVKICHNMDIDMYAFEDGYFRPGFITLEPFGVNGNSHFSKYGYDDEINIEHVSVLQMNLKPKRLSRILFSLISNFNFILSKNYQPYRPINSFYWSVRLIRSFIEYKINKRKDSKQIKLISDDRESYKIFFIPLQVFDDTQIIYHSKFKDTYEFILEVLAAFASLNSRDFRVIIKQHPGDRGAINYRNFIKKKAKSLGLEKNIFFNVSTDANKIINISDGLILINSTLGINALLKGKSVYCAGSSVYEDLCSNNGIIEFLEKILNKDQKNDQSNIELLHQLKNATQIKGGFYK